MNSTIGDTKFIKYLGFFMEDSLEMTFISLLYSILEQCSMFWLRAHVFGVADIILDLKDFQILSF